ncbi:MAG: hypothetical protein P8Y70_04925 [Candidatus Lokiarchaeota archaeon]
MIFQDYEFKFFTLPDAIASGLYYVIVGYYVLLFAYFLIIRYRTSKKLYWLFFSILFLVLAIGRIFFIIYDFYLPEFKGILSDTEAVNLFMIFYRWATFFTWMATTCLMGILGILLFPPDTKSTLKNLPNNVFMDPDLKNDYPGYSINLITINIFGWTYPIGRFILNFVLQPLFIAIVPFIFLYLAWRTFGVLRKSYALNALGFFFYYIGRITQGLFDVLGWTHVVSYVPQLIILLSLVIIVIANNYEQLR